MKIFLQWQIPPPGADLFGLRRLCPCKRRDTLRRKGLHLQIPKRGGTTGSNGRRQAVRLPKEFNFRGDSVYVQKVGEAVILVPFDKDWEVFMHGLNSFSTENVLNKIKRNREKGLYISTITLAELEFGNANSLYKERNTVESRRSYFLYNCVLIYFHTIFMFLECTAQSDRYKFIKF